VSRLGDAGTTAAGLTIGASLIGLPVGIWLARRYLATPTTTAKPYHQGDAVVTSITNLTHTRKDPS